MACNVVGIPQRLYKNIRPVDDLFDKVELLYLRIPPYLFVNEKPDAASFKTTRQSVNRERFSHCPEDVLFNINANEENDHFKDWGIVSMTVDQIESQSYPHPKDLDEYTFKVKHKPEECMYPHSEIHIFKDGIEGKLKPATLKVQIKAYYREICNVEKTP